MAITYNISQNDNYLLITASGKDDCLQDVINYGSAIIQHAIEHRITQILCDERQLQYALGFFDIFESARFLAENVPTLAKAAVVIGNNNMEDATFWETVAVNRGLHVKIFQEFETAEEWLLSNK